MHLPWRDVAPVVAGPLISTSLTENEAAKLRALAPGQRVLEVGSAYGFSACVMATAGAESVLAVDPFSWLPLSNEQMVANLAACGVTDSVEMRIDTFYAIAPELVEAKTKFGLIFIDGDHSFHAIRHDIEQALKLLEAGGTLAVHDVEESCCCPYVKTAVDLMLPSVPVEMVDTMAVFKP